MKGLLMGFILKETLFLHSPNVHNVCLAFVVSTQLPMHTHGVCSLLCSDTALYTRKLTREVISGEQQQPLMLMYGSLSLPLLLWVLHPRHQLGSLLKGPVSCIDIPQHQLYVAQDRPDIRVMSSFPQQPAQPSKGGFVLLTPVVRNYFNEGLLARVVDAQLVEQYQR